MSTNQDIWGSSSDWECPISGMTGTNQDMKFLTGYFGAKPSNTYESGCLFSGLYYDKFPSEGNFTNEPIDDSISYCGLGNESVWSRVKYYACGPATSTSLINSDDRQVTNFAFCNAQSGGQTGLYYLQDTAQGASWSYANKCRWSPYGVNDKNVSTSATARNRNRNVVPYVQLPIRNMILTATLRVATQLNEDTASTSGMDIRNIQAWDYFDENYSFNFTTHPYILAINIQPYACYTSQADNIDPITGVPTSNRTSANVFSGISLLSPLSYSNGIESDAANPGHILGDSYSYYWSRAKGNITGIPIFGQSTVGQNDFDYVRQLSSDSLQPYCLWLLPHEDAVFRAMNNNNNYAWYYLEYYEGLKEWIMEQLACFGLFFTLDKATAQTGSLLDEEMYLGILENGIGHGKYSHGQDNKNYEQWEWDTTNSSSYKPLPPGPGPGPDPGENPKGLHQPGFSLAVDNGSVNYVINQTEWRQIWDDVYGGSKNDWEELINGLALYGSNPLNAILNYRWYPFEFNAGTAEQLRLGASLVGPSTHKYNVITASSQGFKSKTASFWCGNYNGFDRNFVNTRKVKARVWLPFYGFYELPMSMVLNHTVNITFQYSIPDDMGIWEIAFGGSMWDFVECQPFVEIPITGDNSLQIAAAKAQRNLSIAMTIGAAVAGIAIGGAIAAPAIANIGAAASEAAWAFGGSNIAAAAATMGPLASEGLLAGLGSGIAGASGALVGGGMKTANTVMQSALQIGNLSTNLPTHTGASDTTFLNLPLSPFIEFYKPVMQEDYNESEYKETVGIACDKWITAESDELASGSLLAATGIADMDTSGMELDEIKELNSLVQSGFYL